MKRVYIDEYGMVYEDEMADLMMGFEDLKRGNEEKLKRSKIRKTKKSKDKQSKGGNDMNKLYIKTSKGKVTEIDKRDGTIKRKAKIIGEVVSMSIKSTLNNPLTYVVGAAIGLDQGLKYKRGFKAGTEAGLATIAVIAEIEVVRNIIGNMEVIKEA